MIETEMQMLTRVSTDPRNPKCVKAAALSQLRVMEKREGVVSTDYNTKEFAA